MTDDSKLFKVKQAEILAGRIIDFVDAQIADRSLLVTRTSLDEHLNVKSESDVSRISQVLVNLLEFGWLARKFVPGEVFVFWTTDQVTPLGHTWSSFASSPPLKQRTTFLDLYAGYLGIPSLGLLRYRADPKAVPAPLPPASSETIQALKTKSSSTKSSFKKTSLISSAPLLKASLADANLEQSVKLKTTWETTKLNLTGTESLFEDNSACRAIPLRRKVFFDFIKNNHGIPRKVLVDFFIQQKLKAFLIERTLKDLSFRREIFEKNLCLWVHPDVANKTPTENAMATAFPQMNQLANSLSTSTPTPTAPAPAPVPHTEKNFLHELGVVHSEDDMQKVPIRLKALPMRERTLVFMLLSSFESASASASASE